MDITIDITDYRYESRIEKMSKIFDAPVVNDCEEYSIAFDNQNGKGVIRGINFDHGVSVMLIDLNVNYPLKLQYRLGRRHPIQFLYCQQGSVKLEDDSREEPEVIANNEAMLHAPKGSDNYTINIAAKENIKFICVDVVRYLFLRKIECDIETIPRLLEDMFKDTVGEKSFYFKTSSSPLTTNALTKIFQSQQKGLERKLLIESKSLKLITTLVQHFRAEHEQFRSNYKFTQADIKLLNKAKNIIIDHIPNTPTVHAIAQKIGMNTNKLQQGFKMLYGKSIRQFTISYKMHLALRYLDEGELSISEVAFRIGYTNKGHFSQLFKKEFGLLPSEYSLRIPKDQL